jgi:hypothetical protein
MKYRSLHPSSSSSTTTVIFKLYITIACLIAMTFAAPCVDYTQATLATIGQNTVADTTCTANAAPFPAGLSLQVGLIVEDNLQLFYIPPQTSEPSYELTADTCASNFDTNMVIFIYNTANSSYEFVASNDDFCNLQSSLTIAVSDEQEVYIAVAGYDASTVGQLILTISMNVSSVSSVDQIRFISQDIEDVAGKVLAMSNAISADTSLATADTNIASIGTLQTDILNEYNAGGLVTDMTAYATSLAGSLTTLGNDATALQTSIANRVATDSTDYDAVVGTINTDISTLTDQASNISTALSTSQSSSSGIDTQVGNLKTGLDTQITTFTNLNSYFSATLGSLESDTFSTFACKYLALTSTSTVPPALMSSTAFNGRLEDVASLLNTLISNLPSQNPTCAAFMTSYSTNLAAKMYISSFSNLQSAYQCYY